MPLTRASVRRTATAAVLSLGLLIPVGCAWGGDESPSPSAAQLESICAEIEEQLGRRDDVAKVDAYYQDSITVPESASVDITMTPGADPQAISDEGVRLVWESRLNPLGTIHVSVIDPVEPINGVATAVNLFDAAQRETLETKYGPHPE